MRIYDASTSLQATGFIIGKHTIATCAHALIERTDPHVGHVYPRKNLIIDIPTSNGDIPITPTEYHFPIRYPMTEIESHVYGYDYGIIVVKEDLSQYGSFDFGLALNAFVENKTQIAVTGFPHFIEKSIFNEEAKEYQNVPVDALRKRYTGYGNASHFEGATDIAENTAIISDVDASSGNSGSPAYITKNISGKTTDIAVGIHVSSSKQEEVNSAAARITSDMLVFFYNNSHCH